MDEYKKYLADRLLSEEQPVSIVRSYYLNTKAKLVQVTYRLLSRALDVHVNTAKE